MWDTNYALTSADPRGRVGGAAAPQLWVNWLWGTALSPSHEAIILQ